jgi:hypothetical protein
MGVFGRPATAPVPARVLSALLGAAGDVDASQARLLLRDAAHGVDVYGIPTASGSVCYVTDPELAQRCVPALPQREGITPAEFPRAADVERPFSGFPLDPSKPVPTEVGLDVLGLASDDVVAIYATVQGRRVDALMGDNAFLWHGLETTANPPSSAMYLYVEKRDGSVERVKLTDFLAYDRRDRLEHQQGE